MKRLYILSLFLSASAFAQPKTTPALQKLLAENKDALFQKVISDPQKYRLQIIYTVIDRDKNNKPRFQHQYFNYDPELYFNPASMVKMPLAFLTAEKLAAMKKGDQSLVKDLPPVNVGWNTTIQFDSSREWHIPMAIDTTAASQKPTLAQFVKRAFLVSENDPYNRMYQFLGQQQINMRLHELGYPDVRITRQFMGLTGDRNRITNPIRFLDNNGNVIFSQPELINTDSFDFSRQILLGDAHFSSEEKIVNQPFDFTRHNNLSLLSMHEILRSVLFPEAFPSKQVFRFDKQSRQFLLQYLSQYPSETPDPLYDTAVYHDSYVKFFFRGNREPMPEGVRVFNKVGWSYGFLTDVSYVVDFKHKIEYMLSATVYVNSDGIINDGRYDYKTIGWPFLYQLGQTIYQHELKRKRVYKPDLSSFKVQYEKRDPNNTRSPLTEIDN